MRVSLLLIASVMLAYSAAADVPKRGVPGRAPFALLNPKFDCKRFTESLAGSGPIGLAVLWNTFGTDTSCLRNVIGTLQISLFELHLVNGPCIRNKRCGRYEPFYGYTAQSLEAAVRKQEPSVRALFEVTASEAAAAILPLLPKGTDCYINPVLETDLSRKSAARVQEWVRPHFPGCRFVWNPVGENSGDPIPGAAVSEGHGMKPKLSPPACIANTDGDTVGTEAEWGEYLERYSGCSAALAWTLEDNCVDGPEFLDPRERSCAKTAAFAAAGSAVVKASNLPRSESSR